MNTTDAPFNVSDEQLARYDRDGFFITDVIVDAATIGAIRADFLRLWQERIEQVDACPDASAGERKRIRERPFIVRLQDTSPACLDLMKSESLLNIGRSIVGPDLDCGYNQAVIKGPSTTRDNQFAWHQDGKYATGNHNKKPWKLENVLDIHKGFTCWIAISETTIENGTLWVLPAHHRQGLIEHDWLADTGDWAARVDEADKTPVQLKPGQMLVFSNLTPHYSGPNVSDQARLVLTFAYAAPGTTDAAINLPVMRSGVRA